MNALRRFFSWYWSGLKAAPVFTLGYIVGGIVVATMMDFPVLAHAALQVVVR